MKKSLLTLLFGVLISVATIAQTKSDPRVDRNAGKDVEKIEATVKLEKNEKEKYLEMKKAQLTRHFSYVAEYKENDPEMFKQKIKENNKQFDSDITAAFGKDRAKVILDASRAKE